MLAQNERYLEALHMRITVKGGVRVSINRNLPRNGWVYEGGEVVGKIRAYLAVEP